MHEGRRKPHGLQTARLERRLDLMPGRDEYGFVSHYQPAR
jgi:hypothetical protein